MSISWSEIFLQGAEIDFGQLLEQWSPLVSGKIQPIGLSAFGDIYFLQPDGSVKVLDVLEGAVHEVAESQRAFGECMNSKEWQDSNLMPEVVWQLQNRGLVRKPGEVYGFAPHPSLAGKVSPETAMVMDAFVWHSICAQLLGPSANRQA
ncbi:MAG: hypothetical protein COB25_001875 [Oceanospirillales bacterium]|nr:hypothetical protein [Oceanospirillales bacterium]